MNAVAETDLRAARRAIVSVFSRYRPGHWPVAVSESMASVRRVDPRIAISDGDLAGLVADYAVQNGHNIYFDMPARRA